MVCGWILPPRTRGLTLHIEALSWHHPGPGMEALYLLDPLGRVLESRAWVELAARVPWKNVPSSGAHYWALSTFQALRTHLVCKDRLNGHRSK